MTREMGSQGKDIALGLADRLRLPVVHHNLVEHDLSEKMHIPESDVHRHLEGKTSLLDRWKFPSRDLANMTACEVYELAEHGNVIIRGWGSAQLLHSVDHVLCVRVCAPLARRVETLMERLDIDDEDYARKEIINNDTAHGHLLKRMTHGDWQNPDNYDLIINTARVPVEEGVDLIEHTLQLPSFQETDASLKYLTACRIEAQLRTTMLSDASMKADAAVINFEVHPQTHKVVLSGGVRNRSTRERMLDTARSLGGVSEVVNNILLVNE